MENWVKKLGWVGLVLSIIVSGFSRYLDFKDAQALGLSAGIWLSIGLGVFFISIVTLILWWQREIGIRVKETKKPIQPVAIQETSRDVQDIEKEYATKFLKGLEVLQFENVAQLYDYVASRLQKATKCVDDITWGSRKVYRTEVEDAAYQNYLKAIEVVCKRGTVTYREVSSLTDGHYFERSINLVKKGYYSYHLGYYDISNVRVPLISYIIIDSSEVILGFYRVPMLQPEGEVYINVRHPLLVKLFEDYFETLWLGSTKIKEGNKISWDIVEQIAKGLDVKM